jgi:hypothetical protein
VTRLNQVAGGSPRPGPIEVTGGNDEKRRVATEKLVVRMMTLAILTVLIGKALA